MPPFFRFLPRDASSRPANSGTATKFVEGQLTNPFRVASRGVMELLESVSPAEIASAVPFVKITLIDPKTRAPDLSKRPLMFDLIQGPQFGAMEDELRFRERSTVSLVSMSINTRMPMGFIVNREGTLEFIVHQPTIVFDRTSRLPWRDMLLEGVPFSLEYGWNGIIPSPRTGAPNPLFDGIGYHDRAVVVPSAETVMLLVQSYTARLMANGEVALAIKFIENGDIAMRNALFSDAVDEAYDNGIYPSTTTDKQNATRVEGILDSIKKTSLRPYGDMWRMGDVLNSAVAPLIDATMRRAGYSAVEMYLGEFNPRAGAQSREYGGETMSSKSIGEFTIPASIVKRGLEQSFGSGRALTLHNFVNKLITHMLGQAPWASSSPDQDRDIPNIVMNTRTLRDATTGKMLLVLYIFDRKHQVQAFTRDPADERDFIDATQQTRANVFAKLHDKGIPVLEFGRAQSMVMDASFEFVPEGLFQNILINRAYREPKPRSNVTGMPDAEARAGRADAREIVPFSILTGDVTMHGNFVFNSFAQVWVEFFGAGDISGIFNVGERTDRFAPGSFTTTYKLVSEGIDPLNTRKKRQRRTLGPLRPGGTL